MTDRQMEQAMGRISTTLDYRGFSTVDVVLEAVVENLDVKWKVLEQAEAVISPECVFASNTSSLPITRIASRARRPGRVVGMHFFNPVHRMPLVEVIRGEETDDVALATIYALARSLGKTPVVVQDRPGFLVNRILAPYLNEALLLVRDGASIAAVDQALIRFGMPMGPLRLYDEVGIDVADKVGGILREALGDRLEAVASIPVFLESGRLGRKAGRGFYRHKDGAPQPDPDAESIVRGGMGPPPGPAPGEDAIVERCMLRMIDEGARCLEEGVVQDAEDLDLALVLGIGFPPFRGGPMRHADALGAAWVVERLEALAADEGPRFEPSALLREAAREGKDLRRPFPPPR